MKRTKIPKRNESVRISPVSLLIVRDPAVTSDDNLELIHARHFNCTNGEGLNGGYFLKFTEMYDKRIKIGIYHHLINLFFYVCTYCIYREKKKLCGHYVYFFLTQNLNEFFASKSL